jgi:hypothetical protein
MISESANLYQIRQRGVEILNRELGPVATIRFLQQYEVGIGDYSIERHQWLDKMNIDDIAEAVRKRRKSKKRQ